MWDSTQARYSGAIIGTIATESAKPNTQNRHTTLNGVERSGELASGKIGHRFLLGVAAMS